MSLSSPIPYHITQSFQVSILHLNKVVRWENSGTAGELGDLGVPPATRTRLPGPEAHPTQFSLCSQKSHPKELDSNTGNGALDWKCGSPKPHIHPGAR